MVGGRFGCGLVYGGSGGGGSGFGDRRGCCCGGGFRGYFVLLTGKTCGDLGGGGYTSLEDSGGGLNDGLRVSYRGSGNVRYYFGFGFVDFVSAVSYYCCGGGRSGLFDVSGLDWLDGFDFRGLALDYLDLRGSVVDFGVFGFVRRVLLVVFSSGGRRGYLLFF